MVKKDREKGEPKVYAGNINLLIMAKGKMLTDSEKGEIVKLLAAKKSTLEISKSLKRDHRTVKRFIDGKDGRKKHKSGRAKEVVFYSNLSTTAELKTKQWLKNTKGNGSDIGRIGDIVAVVIIVVAICFASSRTD
ncbi:element Tc3 transposase [Octopus vulgaris]|uniref:Element Tc3 transposase n=1 Tax=Octopus vulgaris TaxID=6645 RepID=A0AA36F1L3_OCTVU|nr:element Tc3 transposase [Octopus vulgaris]